MLALQTKYGTPDNQSWFAIWTPISLLSLLTPYCRYGNEPNQVQFHELPSTRPQPVETTLYALSKQERDDVQVHFRISPIQSAITTMLHLFAYHIQTLQGNFYKIPIEITEVDDSRGWWFWSCDRCWKTTKPNGSIFRCTDIACSCIAGSQRFAPTTATPNKQYRPIL
jgi:hypothetical protein